MLTTASHNYCEISVLVVNNVKKNERLIRIELTLVAWKATVLPLNYRRMNRGYGEKGFFFKDKVKADKWHANCSY